jgi:single-strand DNA-binding protein
MNKVILIGRLTKDPEIRYSQGQNSTAVARYTLAVTRSYHKDGEQESDFIGCIAFGKAAEIAEKYFKKGLKISVVGRIQTGSYKKDGQTIYTTDVVVEEQEFVESKGQSGGSIPERSSGDGFMHIPDDMDNEMPFN